jgi:hypothetical protein
LFNEAAIRFCLASVNFAVCFSPTNACNAHAFAVPVLLNARVTSGFITKREAHFTIMLALFGYAW